MVNLGIWRKMNGNCHFLWQENVFGTVPSENKYVQICSKHRNFSCPWNEFQILKGNKQPEKQKRTNVIENMWSQVLCTDLIKTSPFQCLCQTVFVNLRQNMLATSHLETQALISVVQRQSFVQNCVTSNEYFMRVNIYVNFGYALCTGKTLPENVSHQ